MTLPDWAVAEIKSLFDEYGLWVSVRFKVKSLEDQLGYPITKEIAYDVLHDIKPEDKVAPCGKPKKLTAFLYGYQFCSRHCECAKSQKKENTTKTCQEKYGTDHHLSSPKVRSKINSTNNERYGGAVLGGNSPVRKKLVSDGYKFGNSCPDIKTKTTAALLKRYGVSTPFDSELIREKSKNTFFRKYGVSNSALIDISPNVISILKDKELFKRELEKYHSSLPMMADSLNLNRTTISRYCTIHDIDTSRTSSQELEMEQWLFQQGIAFIKNDRTVLKPYEIDFYLPDNSLAIELNGLYWHSDKFKENNYHREKHLMCKSLGITLLMINEDEWSLRSDNIKKRISHLLGQSTKGSPARKLSIKKISQRDANNFFDINHIQGQTSTISYAIGAYDGDILVGAMSFSKQRTTGNIELSRFSTDGKSYAGLFSRLFINAIRETGYKRVITFADLRYTDGDVYTKNGFVFEKELRPDYRYVKNDKSFHKSSFTKKKIANKFGLVMTELTEREAMVKLGFHRIYDCGKIRFVWESQ